MRNAGQRDQPTTDVVSQTAKPICRLFFLAKFFLCQCWFNAFVTFASQVRSFTCSSNSGRGKILDAVWRRIAQRLEQSRRHQDRHIMRLAIQHPRRLLRRQAGRQLVQQPQKLMLFLSHSSLNCLNTGCRWPSRLTPHQVFSFVTYLAQ